MKGTGTVKLGSGAFEGQYSFNTRFADGVGTNPEALIGTAHASRDPYRRSLRNFMIRLLSAGVSTRFNSSELPLALIPE